MTSRIIYHDFQKNDSITTEAKTATKGILTAAVLAKCRRIVAVNQALHITSITLCGLCIAASIFVFGMLFGGM